jgi:hypothetical protein
MSRALAALASRVIGRRVTLTCPGCGRQSHMGTVTRVTAAGITVAVPGQTSEGVTFTD